jgi:predicted nuclease with TOPRIM domain
MQTHSPQGDHDDDDSLCRDEYAELEAEVEVLRENCKTWREEAERLREMLKGCEWDDDEGHNSMRRLRGPWVEKP